MAETYISLVGIYIDPLEKQSLFCHIKGMYRVDTRKGFSIQNMSV